VLLIRPDHRADRRWSGHRAGLWGRLDVSSSIVHRCACRPAPGIAASRPG